jgi:HAE1 family hydrophobic/amphiphilic exporter-1
MKLVIDRPVATAMVFLALLATGVYSFLNTPIELAPKEDFPKADIFTSWPGVPPEVVQTQVTAPLEEACATVKGITKMTSTSQIGFSQITLEFDPKTNMEFATLALREELTKARPLLPPLVRPDVRPYVPEDFRVRPFLEYTVSGRYGLQELQELVKEKLEIGLGSVRGVSGVEVAGGSEPEIRVTLDEDRIARTLSHGQRGHRACRPIRQGGARATEFRRRDPSTASRAPLMRRPPARTHLVRTWLRSG